MRLKRLLNDVLVYSNMPAASKDHHRIIGLTKNIQLIANNDPGSSEKDSIS